MKYCENISFLLNMTTERVFGKRQLSPESTYGVWNNERRGTAEVQQRIGIRRKY